MQPVIRKPTEEEKKIASKWPIWEKEKSKFPWKYSEQETCLIIDGDVIITNSEGQEFNFGAGDFVVFPEGMKCTWDIKRNVRKYYKFG